MDTIYKYELVIDDVQHIPLPSGAKCLHVAMQNGHLCLWAQVNTTRELVNRFFRIYGTGHPMQDPASRYIGTVQDGPLVWHVFEA